jgi:DNA sulfur modification protein DndD
MNIQEITIENFRSYYGVNPIHFKDGLVLFIGDNGDGKTTFFEALEWLFDTSKTNMELELISRKRISELEIREKEKLRVSMTFDHNGKKSIEKSFTFTKEEDGEVSIGDFEFKGFDDDGSQRIPLLGKILLDRCFDAAIRKYCLFKGESELNVFNKSEAMRYLIETFSNIRQFEPYLGFVDFAEKESSKIYQHTMKLDRKNQQKEEELRKEMEKLKRDLHLLKIETDNKCKEKNEYADKLENIERNRETSELLKDLNERLQELNRKKAENQARIDENYTVKLLDEYWILCGFTSIFNEYQKKVDASSLKRRKMEDEEKKKKGKQEAYKEIAGELASGVIPLSIYIPDESTMKEMIMDEFCKVCGRQAEKGSEAYLFMVEKLNELLKSQQTKEKKEEYLLFPNNFIIELEKKKILFEYDQDQWKNLIFTIEKTIEFNEARKNDVRKIQENIDNEEDNKKKLLAGNDSLTEEQLCNAYHNISNWYRLKVEAEKKIDINQKEIQDKTERLQEVQLQYDSLASKSCAKTYAKVNMALRKIKDAFEHAKDKNTKDFLFLLEEKSNQYLKMLNTDDFFGIIHIVDRFDGSAKIELYDKNDTHIESPNQALKTTMYISVLFAVSELTSIKRENDYPLIFDAPTSSFTKSKEKDFFKIISEIKKQCVIFTKSFLPETENFEDKKVRHSLLINDERVKLLNGSVYLLEKKRPFDEKDLSTIQTVITQIK